MAQPRFRVVHEEEVRNLLPGGLLEESGDDGSGAESPGPEPEAGREERAVPPLRLRAVRPGALRTPSSPPPFRSTNSRVRATAFRPVGGGALDHQVPPVPGRGRASLDMQRGRSPETRPRGWEGRVAQSLPDFSRGRTPPPPMMGRRPPGLGIRYRAMSPAPLGLPPSMRGQGMMLAPRTPSPPLMVHYVMPANYTMPCVQCHRACQCPRWHWVQQ